MDMGQPKKNQTLERVDNTLGYSPENCRWATRAEQSRNRTDNVYLNVGPEKLVAADAVKLLAVTRSALHQRMKRKNETMQQAFNYYYKDIQQKKKLLGVTRAQQTLTLHGVE